MAKKTSRPRLGRGLASLISSSNTTPPAEAQDPAETQAVARGTDPSDTKAPHDPLEVPVAQIAPNPFQPRMAFDDDQLADLAASIAQQGILQPLVVAPADGDTETDQPYVLIAGERRLRAAKKAGLDTVPCLVRNPSRQQMLEWALVENLQRSDLNPLERATAYSDYIDRFSLTQAQAAERLGQARTTIANHLRLLDLTDEVQELIRADKLSFGHAKVLGALIGNPEPQNAVARKVVDQGLSVRETEALITQTTQGDTKAGKATKAKDSDKDKKSPYIRDIEEQLTQSVGTRVEIRAKKKDAGRIIVEYYSLDDFDRIATALGAKLDS